VKFIRITDELSVSKLILGTVNFGTMVDEAASFAIMDAYFARGGDTLDTAKVYGSWNPSGISLSEVTVGNWLKARGLRDRVKIITKGCHPILGQPGPRVNAACVKADIEESLLRLQVEVIDHWYLHRDDETVPVEEIIDALECQRKQGHIRSYGASNWSTARIEAANAYAEAIGAQGFTSSQINWSLAQGNPEAMAPQGLVSMTPEIAASPILDTIIVSAMPMDRLKNCSSSSGISRRLRDADENSGSAAASESTFLSITQILCVSFPDIRAFIIAIQALFVFIQIYQFIAKLYKAKPVLLPRQ